MLDHTLRHFKRELNNAMDTVLDFRRIIRKYFLCRVPGEEDSDDELFYGASGGAGNKGNLQRRYEKEGMGALKVANSDFIHNLKLLI